MVGERRDGRGTVYAKRRFTLAESGGFGEHFALKLRRNWSNRWSGALVP